MFLYYLAVVLSSYLALIIFLALMGSHATFNIKLARFAWRSLVSLVLLLVCAIYGVIVSLLLTLVGQQGMAQWAVARAFLYTMCPALGIKFEMENEERMWSERPVVFLGNHQSELDVLVLGRVFPKYCSVSAKRSLKWIPFLGWFMALSGTIFIDRANRKSALTAFDTAAKDMKSRRQSVWIFPEGTRSYATTSTMLPLKKGAFHLAVQAQVPIIPVVIQNYSHVLNLKEKRFDAGTIKIKVLEKVETRGIGEDKADIDALVEKVGKMMADELKAMGLGAKFGETKKTQ